jgi:hypothetical protein
MDNISKVRQSLNRAQKRQADVMNRLLNSQPYIAAQVYDRYKTCGNKNCKCKKGELHGPFLWIYQNKKNQKILSTTVDKNKEKQAKDLAIRYKQWLQNRQKLRELNRVIQDHLDEMEKFLEKEAREFATTRKSGRPKKIE